MIFRNPLIIRLARLGAWSIILPILVGLSACQNQKPKPPAEAPPEAEDSQQQIQPQPAIDPVLLHGLLDQAEAAVARGHLTYPIEDSAYEIYLRILGRQPDQQDALRGMEHIVEQYIAMAMQALERHRYASARSMLARARLIDPSHPSIEPTDRQIRLLSQAERKVMKLTQEQLNNPDEELTGALQAMATLPADNNCHFTISAKNDAQGRWIYQRLAAGSDSEQGTARIRAQIRIRLPAAVERLCFPA